MAGILDGVWKNCNICGECLMTCPVMFMSEEEAKNEVYRLICNIEPVRALQECTFCRMCQNYCPENLRPYEMIIIRLFEKEEESHPAAVH